MHVKEIVYEENEVVKQEIKKKQREEGIELLRIIAMFMVLLLHYCGKGDFLKNEIFKNINVEIAWIIEAFSIVAVNCYVLISGYFLVNSKCDRKKIIKTIIQVLFYSWTIFIIFKVFINVNVSLRETFTFIFPITLKTYWFVTCYIILYLLAPFINSMIKNISKKEYKILIGILLTISVTSWIFSQLEFSVLDSTNGYGIIWFITLYCIAGYIRIYGKENYNKYKYLILYILISLLIYFSRILISILDKNQILSSKMFYDYNSITVTLSSIYLFMFFKKVKINQTFIKRVILKIAPLTFAVYIIHEHPLISKILYKNILHTERLLNSKKFVFIIFISCVAIFAFCCIIEFLRSIIIKQIEKTIKFQKKMHKYDKV